MDENKNARLGVHKKKDRVMNNSEDDKFNNEDKDEDEENSLSLEMDSALKELASRLCATCQGLCRGEAKVLKYWKYNGNQYPQLQHHPSLSSLRDSVDAGCPLCKEVAQTFEEHLDMKPEVRDAVADSWYIACRLEITRWCLGIDGVCFSFTFYDSDGLPVHPELEVNLSFFPAERLGLGPEYKEYAAGATHATFTPNIGLAQHWFNTCLNDHDCRDEGRPKFLPTRLIEVRTHGDTSSNTIARLCEADDLSGDASYLTLSHCWGGNTMFTLTKGNLDILKRDIPVQQLPELFKDALRMTSELGMKYIWIDCLCILQDCQDDWAYEAARMGDVYRHARCNIAATGYKDGKRSLLKERPPLPLINFPLYLDHVLGGVKEEFDNDVRTLSKGFYVKGDDEEFYYAVTEGPLNSRGWVAQERALSPAILHFTPEQMWWECRSHIASESFPYINLPWGLTEIDNIYGPDALRCLSVHSDIQEVYRAWTNFVSFYVNTDLTVESDRFPALHGIARAFGELTKDNLVAGCWEGDLIQSLAWGVFDQYRAKKIPCTQRAPSWSWAYLCVPHHPPFFFDSRASLCTCRRILSDDLGFRSDLQYASFKKSAVRGIEITGPLRKLPMEMERLSELPGWRDSVKKLHVQYDVADSSFFSAEDIANPEQAWHWKEPTHVLPWIEESFRHVNCLLLYQVPEAEHSNMFRRLGMVNITFKDDASHGEFMGIHNGNGKSKLSTVFEDCGLHDFILI